MHNLEQLMKQSREDNPEVFETLRKLKRKNMKSFAGQAVVSLGTKSDVAMRKALSARLVS